MSHFASQKGLGEKPVDPNDPLKGQSSPVKTKLEGLEKERNLRDGDRNIHPRYNNSSANSEDSSLKAGTIGSHPSGPEREEKVSMSPARLGGDRRPSNRVFSPLNLVRSNLPSTDERASDTSRAIPPLNCSDEEDLRGEELTGTFKRAALGKEENTERVPSLEMHSNRRDPQTKKGSCCFCWRIH